MAKPLITFFVMAFNQEQFVREAVKGAFAQTYSPLEILLSDDCSPDRTFEIMREMAAAYRGPHRIALNRNQKNLGIGAHLNRVVELSQGELLIGAAGDDISVEGRAERIYGAWIDSGQTAFSIYSNMIEIDSAGVEKGIWNKGTPPIHPTSLAVAVETGHAGVYGCTQGYHRKVFDFFGPMDERAVHEDETIPFRSLLLGTIKYVDEPLVYYRRHESNSWDSSCTLTLERRRQILTADRAHLVTWLRDLRTASVRGIIEEEESERLQAEVIERLREKSIEWRFYMSRPFSGVLLLLREYLGLKTLRQILRVIKRRLQSQRDTVDYKV
jgi:glycosyltransferase involved in cell wall biosynthesis